MNATPLNPHTPLIGSSISVSPRAKLNLRLKIIGRRQNGFHELSMLNAEISLCDDILITFEQEPGVRIELRGDSGDLVLSDPSQNLAARAAQAFLERSAIDSGARLSLAKRIPIGAGLGGGSSDAAAVLRALNEKAGSLALSQEQLLEIAQTLGADVSYFLLGGLCAVSGIGENLLPLSGEAISGAIVFLFVPKLPISTPQLYSFYRSRFPNLQRSVDGAMQGLKRGDSLSYEDMLQLVENDFEQVLEDFAPSIAEQIKLVRGVRGLKVALTGSGSAFFALPSSKAGSSGDSLAHLEDLMRPSGTKVLALRLLPADLS
ncbi:MAG: 4-(cytidine 5'-diphospho)-2-C-methyl-D-erythritol kinase [Deltaproteobacteria bacterium]|nr:4-(cytidine 5'-diphospho)-2-C-methyl-D-erythritol kinase [Deltaproteobacteria bacterium]